MDVEFQIWEVSPPKLSVRLTDDDDEDSQAGGKSCIGSGSFYGSRLIMASPSASF